MKKTVTIPAHVVPYVRNAALKELADLERQLFGHVTARTEHYLRLSDDHIARIQEHKTRAEIGEEIRQFRRDVGLEERLRERS